MFLRMMRPASVRTLTLVLGLAFVLIYVVPLGYRPLISPDETRYEEIPREMIEHGDWVVPRLNRLRYFEKPPMGYWANALSLLVFGENNFGVRAVGVICAGLASVFVYLLGLRTGAGRKTALLGAAVYLSFAEVYLVGTFSVLDNLLALFLCMGVTVFHASVDEGATRRAAWLALGAGAAFGCAFLTKGFLGFALPAMVLLPWLIWTRSFAATLPVIGLAIAGAALVSFPWVIMIHLQEPDFWRYFFFEEHVRRFLSDNAQHQQPFYYFIVLLPGLAFPWIFLSGAAYAGLRSLKRPRTAHSTIRLLWLWLIVPFVFFSMSSGKLTTYILPCFAPAAGLMAVGLGAYFSHSGTKLLSGGVVLVLVVLLGLGVFLLVAQMTPMLDAVYQTHEMAKATLGCLVVFSGVLGLGWALRVENPRSKLGALLVSMAALMGAAQFTTPDELLERKAPGLLLAAQAPATRDALIVSDSGVIRAVSWYLQRSDVYLIAGGELTYGLTYPDSKSRWVDPLAFEQFLSTGRDVMLVCKRQCPDAYVEALPLATEPHQVGLYVLWYVRARSADLTAVP